MFKIKGDFMKKTFAALLVLTVSVNSFACVSLGRSFSSSGGSLEQSGQSFDDSSVGSSEGSANSGRNCSRNFIHQVQLDSYLASGVISVDLQVAINEARLELNISESMEDMEVIETYFLE